MEIAKTLNQVPLLRIALMLIAGILLGDRWGAAVPTWIVLAGSATLIVAALTFRRMGPYTQGGCVMAAVMLLGACLTTLRNRQLEYPFSSQPVVYEAVVASPPQVRGKTLQCDLSLTSVVGYRLHKPVKVKASLLRDTLRQQATLHVGDGIKARSVLQPLRPWRAGSNFDYVRWLHTRGVVAQTFVYYTHWQKAAVSLMPLSRFDRTKIRALRWRHRLLEQYGRMGLADQQYAVVAAMTLGDKSYLSRATRDLYAIAGASHVLALSGLHLGIIYTILTLLLGGGLRWRWLCQGLILTAVWTYVVMVGMSPSVVRSATMLTICSICTALQRQRLSVNTLAFAAIVMLIANPPNLWDVGFQMSFMAVLAIAICYSPLFHLLPLTNNVLRWAWGLAAVSLAAQIGTAPLVLYYFGRFSTYFLLTNFIVIPAATLILYGAVAMLLTTPIAVLQHVVAQALGTIVQWMNNALAWTATLPGADIGNIHINTFQLLLIYIAIASFGIIAQRLARLRHLERLDAFYIEGRVKGEK